MYNIDVILNQTDKSTVELIKLRGEILSKNIYRPDKPYEIKEGNFDNVINSTIDSIFGGSFDIRNNLVSRILGPNTPLAQIANIQLLKELKGRVIDNARDEFMPDISFKNLLDGNPDTKFISRRKDYRITKSGNDIPFYLNVFLGHQPSESILSNNPTQREIYEKTGKAQIDFIVDNLKRNAYSGLNLPVKGESTHRTRNPENILTHIDSRPENSGDHTSEYDYIRRVDGFLSETGNENKVPG